MVALVGSVLFMVPYPLHDVTLTCSYTIVVTYWFAVKLNELLDFGSDVDKPSSTPMPSAKGPPLLPLRGRR